MYHLLTHEGHTLPEDMSSGLIAQEILVYENEKSQDIKHVIDDQHQHARIMVLGENDAASFWEGILKDLEGLAPEGTTLEINGYGKVMYTNIQEVIKSHLTSTALAVGLIGLVMVLLFKSVSMGLIGVLPLILTVMMNFALMSAFNIAVDVGTTIIASIAFGIGIDYSIHFLSTLNRLKASGQADLEKRILAASHIVGMPILINSLTLAGGFLVLTASSFQVLQVLGLFISMTMLLSALNALVLIPLAYYLWHRRLGLDLISSGKKKRSNLDQL
jgi:predicted RND superfamily exporter protein